jgi:glycosyltransferase involved in cell wall biosynthesis
VTRALIIEGSGNLWGSERALLDLLKAMPTLTLAVCSPPDRPLSRELDKLAIRALPYYVFELHTKSRWRRALASIGVLRACLEFRPHVIYLNQSGAYKTALPAATLLNIPIVSHIRIFEDAAYLARQRPSSSRLTGVIAISSAIEEEVRRFPELDAIPLHRIYDAYTPAVRSLETRSGERVVNRIACVGRLVPVKGQDVLLGAIAELKSGDGAFECLIVGSGDGPFARELKQIALGRHLENAVQWAGFVSDVTLLLRTCSVLACPSHREPLGRVIFEAWDAGAVPVVFSGSGGAAEIVSAADAGVLYHTQDAESLATALRQVMELDPKETSRLIANGRSWMAINCDPHASGEAVSAVLRGAGVLQRSFA